MRLLLPHVSLTLLLAACGGNVALGDAGATVGATSGTGASTAMGSASTASTSGAGGAGGACVGYVDLVVDDGAPQHLTSVCSSGWNPQKALQPFGFIIEGGVVPPDDGGVSLGGPRLEMWGCVSVAPDSEGVELLAYDVSGPGAYTVGLVSYTDAGGTSWGTMSDPIAIDVTELGVVGAPIEGTVTATVSHGGDAAHKVTGSFHVCRAPDELVP
jgi:hypothetical protein